MINIYCTLFSSVNLCDGNCPVHFKGINLSVDFFLSMIYLFNRTVTMVFEGQEKDDFWNVLGGKEEYASEKRLQVHLKANFCT